MNPANKNRCLTIKGRPTLTLIVWPSAPSLRVAVLREPRRSASGQPNADATLCPLFFAPSLP